MSQREDDFWQIVAVGLQRSDFTWLEPLRPVLNRIIVFGCWDDGETIRQCREPYVLLRILDATEAVVVDKEEAYIHNAQSWYEETRARHPELFGTYDLRFVASDMTGEAQELPSNNFDLAYCSGVLYFMQSDARQLRAAVSTMARVVRPGGWVIASEDEGLDTWFDGAGLIRAQGLEDAPQHAYCYRKAGSTERGCDQQLRRRLACLPGTGNTSADPRFVDAPGGDYHLSAGSPAIGAGTDVSALPTDWEGNLCSQTSEVSETSEVCM